METKTCSMCKIEKHINNFYKKFSECEDCHRKRGLKRYYEKKDKISNPINERYTMKKKINYYSSKLIDIYILKI